MAEVGESVTWFQYDGSNDEPSIRHGVVWAKAPLFRQMLAWWVKSDEGMHYVAQARGMYATGCLVGRRWRDAGDVVEAGHYFEETHAMSRMVKWTEKKRVEFANRYKPTMRGRVEMESFNRLLESQ